MSSPMLWHVSRATGVVLLALLTLTMVLGAVSARRRPGSPWWPRFVTQGLHRNVALLSMALLAVHVVSVVVDDFVDIGWRDAVVPFGASYQPIPLALGAVAFDLAVAAALSGALRSRLPEAAWRGVHAASHLSWAAAVLHGLAIGTDANTRWMQALVATCLAAVLAAAVARVLDRPRVVAPVR